MNKFNLIVFILLFNSPCFCQYDKSYVKVFSNDTLNSIQLNRNGNRVKCKVFLSRRDEKSAYNSYYDWSKGRNVIYVGSCTYTDDYIKPTGLTIDNGNIVNNTLLDTFDGLVVVYPTGGILVSNLENADLSLRGSSVDPNRIFDLNNSWDLNTFKNWALSEQVSVFQTHLLIYKNNLEISSSNSSNKTAPRRFLAIGKNDSNTVYHFIINIKESCSLYKGSKLAERYLKNECKLNYIASMINLDTGSEFAQEFFKVNGLSSNLLNGNTGIKNVTSLLVYYYE
jgi:hypothetical protein